MISFLRILQDLKARLTRGQLVPLDVEGQGLEGCTQGME